MLPWNKLKWEHNNPKSIGHSESSLKKVIHSITAVTQGSKTQINNLKSYLKNCKQKTNKA